MGILAKLSGRPVFQKILENSGWQIGDRVVRLGLNFFVTAWIARYLGPQSYGKLSYVTALVSVFLVTSTLGIEWIVLREFSNAKDKVVASRRLVTLIKLRILTGLIGQIILLLVLKVVGGDSSITLMALGQSFLLLFQAFDAIDYWFQSQMQVRQVVILRSIGFFVASMFRVYLLMSAAPLESFVLPFLVEIAVANALLIRAYLVENPGAFRGFLGTFELTWVNEVKSRIPVLFLTAVFLQMYLKMDQLLLQWLSGPEAVGIFSIPVRLSEILFLVGASIIGSSAPALFLVYKDEPHVFRQRFEKLLRLLNIASIGVCFATVVVAEPLVNIVFGEQYGRSIPVLQTYIWCLPAVLQGGARNVWLMSANKTNFALLTAALGTALSLIFNVIAIPKLGVMGSAISAVVAMWISGVASTFLDRELRPLAWIQLRSFLPWRIFEK